jgi:formylmethanofuran dehydrogenase subunit E
MELELIANVVCPICGEMRYDPEIKEKDFKLVSVCDNCFKKIIKEEGPRA